MLSRFMHITLLTLMTARCNSVFYQPDSREFYTPALTASPYVGFSIPTPDGETLAAWHILPQGKPIGTVVHFHGNGENMTTHFIFTAWLATLGFHVVTIDYRGYYKSTGTPTRDGLKIDAIAVLNYLSSDPTYGKDDLFVVGQSLGAAVVLPAIAEIKPKQLRAIAIDSSFAEYRTAARRTLGSIWLTWLFQYPLSFLVTNTHSPREAAENIAYPLLAFHSERDHIVAIENGQELFAAFGRTSDKEFVVVPEPGHIRALGSEKDTFRRQLALFFCRTGSHRAECEKRVKAMEPIRLGPEKQQGSGT